MKQILRCNFVINKKHKTKTHDERTNTSIQNKNKFKTNIIKGFKLERLSLTQVTWPKKQQIVPK